jgi:hypothetical protein
VQNFAYYYCYVRIQELLANMTPFCSQRVSARVQPSKELYHTMLGHPCLTSFLRHTVKLREKP